MRAVPWPGEQLAAQPWRAQSPPRAAASQWRLAVVDLAVFHLQSTPVPALTVP